MSEHKKIVGIAATTTMVPVEGATDIQWFFGEYTFDRIPLTLVSNAKEGDMYYSTPTGKLYQAKGDYFICKGTITSVGGESTPGADGRGISSAEIVEGELVLTYTDETTETVGKVVGADGQPGENGTDGARWFFGTEFDAAIIYPVTGAKKGDLYVNTNTNNVYQLGDSNWIYKTNIKGTPGTPGEKGDPGTPGYTPVKDKDYFDGDDGFSPMVSVVDITGGHQITITDKDGAKIVDVMDGAPGEKGDPGKNGDSPVITVSNITGGHRITITHQGTIQNIDVMDGEDGSPGTPGTPGTSVTVTKVETSSADGGENKVTFSDGKTLTVKNGSKGSTGATGAKGEDGYTPKKGVDYWTDADKAEIIGELSDAETVEILLPSYAVATVGVEFNIYYKNVVWSTKPIDCYGLKWTISNTGVSMQRLGECLRITPTSANIGEHTLKLRIMNPITNAVITEKEMRLIICERTTVTGRNVVYMGDSLTYSRQGLYAAEIQYNLSNGGIVSVGTQTGAQATNQIGEVKHEGYNGATCGGFLNPNIVSGYTNPFYNTSTKSFDFAQFVNTIGKSVHAVCLNLGANNLGNDIQGVADLQTIISKIKAYNAELPIIVSLAPQTAGQDSWRGGEYTATEMRYHWRNLVKNFIKNFDSKISNVYVSTPYFNVDPDNDFPVENVTKCARDTTQINRQNDSLHPTRIGTLKMADSYYATLLYVLSKGYTPEEPEEPVVNLVDYTTAKDSSPDTTTLFKDEWVNGYYLSASSLSAKAGCIVTNTFPHTSSQTLKIEGVLLDTQEHKNRFRWYHFDANGDRPWPSYINYATGENGSTDDVVNIDAANNTITVKCSSAKVYSRFSCYVAGTNADVKVTVVE